MDVGQMLDVMERDTERIKKLEDAIRETLSIVGALWADVNYHPSSKWARDVKYFTDVLKGE